MYNLISHLNVEQNIDVGKYLSKNPLNKRRTLTNTRVKKNIVINNQINYQVVNNKEHQ